MRTALLSLSLLTHSAPGLARPQEPAPLVTRALPTVLVVSGANNHDWQWTTPSLVRILQQSGKFHVDVTYEPAQTFVEDDGLDGYSAIVLDYNGPRWGEAAEQRFLEAVGERHVGVVVVHAADNAFPGWVEYEELVGDLWRDGTGHGSFHPFDIDVVDREHPITRSLPTILKHPDELYHKLVNTQGVPRRVLASAFSAPETGGTGNHEPMLIVREWRGARVFHTPLGHVWTNTPMSQASHRDPQFHAVLVRGTEWAATGSVSDELWLPGTPAEAAAGWRSLADLARFAPRDPARPSRWEQRGECLVLRAGGDWNDLVTRDTFSDFELEFEWKTTIAGNSGVKYRVPEGTGGVVAPEYQLLDGAAEAPPQHRAASLYDVCPVEAPPLRPFGEFNRSRIVVRGMHVEHWLNGERTVATALDGAPFEAQRAASKFKDHPTFARLASGRIALQDHGDEVWFRGLRVRDLAALDARAEDALPPADLAGWSRVGDAAYARVGHELVGSFGPAQLQSFLVSDRQLGDFVFEVELRFDSPGNSGLQVRSHVRDGRLQGYQVEVDPSDRAWSGGLYDEGRRGWLAGLADDSTARGAFVPSGWNRYRIECVGPRIRAWVNGIQTCDHLDGEDLTGSLAFQVHGGDPDITLRWRGARLVDLGRHAWSPREDFVVAGEELMPGSRHWLLDLGADAGVRCTVSGSHATLYVGEHAVDLSACSGWRADGTNVVAVLRGGSAATAQVNGTEVAALTSALAPGPTGAAWAAVGLTVGGDALVASWERLAAQR